MTLKQLFVYVAAVNIVIFYLVRINFATENYFIISHFFTDFYLSRYFLTVLYYL